MSCLIFLPIFLINISVLSASYLQAEANYLKPQAERNNIVNTRIWVKNTQDNFAPQYNTGNFIFRPNSLDVDSLLQNNFDAFGDNDMQDSPNVYGYVEREKRSTNHENKEISRKNLKDCKGKDCLQKAIAEKTYVKSKLISKLKPASVFNDYPYEVAILLGDNTIDDFTSKVRKVKESGDINSVIPLRKSKETRLDIGSVLANEYKVDKNLNDDNNNSVVIPKRSMLSGYDSEALKKIEIIEDVSENNSTSKFDRGVFDKDERGWQQNLQDTTYKVSPKYPKNKLINERGLIKVLSMLTKTFKKIMKQHSDIRKIHSKLHNINDEVTKNAIDVSKKYRDIEEKYAYISAVSQKIKAFEANLNIKEEYFKSKDREMSKNLLEFENQQKKFLIQQKQFYNIQKLMLAQNEKINIKQNLIAKTQSEISHRQNNFARILKKAKQIYIDNKLTTNKPLTSTIKPDNDTETNRITHTTTASPFTTESIKINLFSIPAMNKLVNHDLQILKDKDEQPVDDLIYKYYFNNTFIDNLMKSKILSTFMTTAENTEIARNAKNKRDEIETTLLLPINMNKTDNTGKLNRERRWIRHRHQSKAKLKKTAEHNYAHLKFNDEKPLGNKNDGVQKTKDNLIKKLFSNNKNNPFLIMAKSFCNEIGQNVNEQMLGWCVEKSLRRLQLLDSKAPGLLLMPTETPNEPTTSSDKPNKKSTSVITKSTVSPITSKGLTKSPVTASSLPMTGAPTTVSELSLNTIFFPDNDELEANLKEFELKPDTEGNVYYDGSLHASDIAGLTGLADSEGFSDILPGLDSNSRVNMDPLTLNLQTRRDTLRRLNPNVLKKLYG